MERIKSELAQKTVESSAGGGMVTVVASGAGEIISIKIEKDVVNPEDVEMLQDLVMAAANSAIEKSKELAQGEMAKITGGLRLPGMPF